MTRHRLPLRVAEGTGAHTVELAADPGPLAARATWLADGVLRLRIALPSPDPAPSPDPDFSWAVLSRTPATGVLRTRVEPDGATTVIGPPEGPHLVVGEADLRVRQGGPSPAPDLCILGIGDGAGHPELRLAYPSGAQTYGLGEKSGRLQKRGGVFRFWNTDAYLYDGLTEPLYKAIPFWITVEDGRATGVFVDEPGLLTVDLGAFEAEVCRVRAPSDALDVYVIPGPDPLDVIRRFQALVGRPALPPRWALGFHQCRYSYYPEPRVRALAEGFRNRGIPCDGIWFDIHYMDGFRCFTWDPDGFPDPAALISDLHRQGFKAVVMIDPGLKVDPSYGVYAAAKEGDHLVKNAEGVVYEGAVWPGACSFPDFLDAKTRRWWGELYGPLVDAGVDGVWNDMNEPAVFKGTGTFPPGLIHRSDAGVVEHDAVHNVYGMQMARATFEGLLRLRPMHRPFVLTRASYAGGQRFAAAWSGDNRSRWEDLRRSIPMALNMAACGCSIYGPDVGGFAEIPSAELVTRWLQLGAVLGFMRMHTSLGTPDQEPWSHGEPWTQHNRTAIELRYRLVTYLYGLAHEASRTGDPIIQALWMRWPGRADLAKIEDVFLLGPGLLVAPALEPGMTSRAVSLPPGRWYTFPDGAPVPMHRSDITVDTPLDRVPLLARGGVIVPWHGPGIHTGALPLETLDVLVFAGDDGSFTLVDDGGDGPADGSGPSRRIPIRLTAGSRQHVLEVGPIQGSHPGEVRVLRFRIFGLEPATCQVTADGVPSTAATALVDGAIVCDVATDALPWRLTVDHPLLPGPRVPRVDVRSDGAPDAALSRTPTLDLAPADHGVSPGWWLGTPISARIHVTWTPKALHLVAAVDDGGLRPGEQDQEDGLLVTVGVVSALRPPLALRMPPPEDGAPAPLVRVGLGWKRQRAAKGSSLRTPAGVRYEVEIPASSIQPHHALEAGLILAFDVAIQHSSRDGRRGIVQWVRGFTHPTDPGGSIRLI